MAKLSLEPYKGTRDFYPEDQFVQNYIFSVMREVVERYGYLEYGASILEETELYKAKTGEEIVNEQTYNFTDRGGRNVTIRPEMTPTVARMVAQKRKELSFPLRWYSIPNLFRYERPQRGRLREHWQLNADIFGVESVEADVEIISLAYDIMKGFGAKDEDFEIRINSRRILNWIFDEVLKLDPKKKHELSKLIDKMEKMDRGEFLSEMEKLVGDDTSLMNSIFNSENLQDLMAYVDFPQATGELASVMEKLIVRGVHNIRLVPSLMRGFDYYTGTVFEVFDLNPNNNRSLFGGGRYDDLVGIFGVEKVPGVGFGMGDVTIRDFLETYNLLPPYRPTIDLYIVPFDLSYIGFANQLASELRVQELNVAVDLTDRKVSAKVKTADKEKIPFVVVVGEEEKKSDTFKVKNLKASQEHQLRSKEIAPFIKQGIK